MAFNPATLLNYTGEGLIAKALTGRSVSDSLKNMSQSPLGGMLGSNRGMLGTGVNAPAFAPIQAPVDMGQLANSYHNSNDALLNQEALLMALKGQNPFQAQSSILNNQMGLSAQQQALADALMGSNGVGNLSNAYSAQGDLAKAQYGLANQYQDVAAGRGPNPAQAMLNQATGQNVANQAALMAGQRGAGANVGLMARQAAQQGGALQQQAVGQGATMQSQQMLNALAGLSAQQQAIGQTNQNMAGIAAQQVGFAQAQQAAQQAQQAAMAQQANQMAQNQMQATTANTQGQQSQQQILQNALSQYNQQQVGQQGSVNAANAGITGQIVKNQGELFGGLLGGIGSAAAMAQGGEVKPHMADGGALAPMSQPQSSFGQFLSSWPGQAQAPMATPTASIAAVPEDAAKKPDMKDTVQKVGKLAMMMASKGGQASHDYRGSGGNVAAKSPKEKAVKAGDSYSNDKIPAYLSEGEIVIPRSVTQSQDPIKASADFVAKTLAKKRVGKAA